MYTQAKLLVIILDLVGLDNLIEYCTPEVQFIIWISFPIVITFGICIRLLNVEKRVEMRQRLLNTVNGNKLAAFSCIIFIIGLFILFPIYLAFDAIDSKIALMMSIFFKSSIGHFLAGIYCFITVYSYVKIDKNIVTQRLQENILNGGVITRVISENQIEEINSNYKLKRNFVIVIGILFGIGSILIGMYKYLDEGNEEFITNYNRILQSYNNYNKFIIYNVRKHKDDDGSITYNNYTNNDKFKLQSYKDSELKKDLSAFALQFKQFPIFASKEQLNELNEIMSIFLYTIREGNLDDSRKIINNLFTKRNLTDNNFEYELEIKEEDNTHFKINLIVWKK